MVDKVALRKHASLMIPVAGSECSLRVVPSFTVQAQCTDKSYAYDVSTDRWGHSPESWEALWKKVFAEAEDVLFAENRVKVFAKLETAPDLTSTEHYLVWSVEIV